MSANHQQHVATDDVGPSPGHGSSASFASHDPDHDAIQAREQHPSHGGPGHAHQVAQSQGLKLDTAASQSVQGSEGKTGGGPTEGSFKRPGGLAENPNARSKTVTLAEGENTFGVSLIPLQDHDKHNG
jgi:protein phosphatase PTC1